MEINALAITVATLLVPGLIGSIVIESLKLYRSWDQFRFIIYSLILSIFSYAIVSSIVSLISPESKVFTDALQGYPAQPFVLFFSTIVSCALALIISYIKTYKLITKFAEFIKASRKHGEGTLFNFYMGDDSVQEIYLWIKDDPRLYHGIIEAYHDADYLFEIILKEVSIYDKATGEFLTKVPRCYISSSPSNVQIEVAAT